MRNHQALLAVVPLSCLLAGCPEENVDGPGVELRVLPATLDLGAALFLVPTTGTVSIINDGETPWDPADPPALEGQDATAFSISAPCALPLAPGALCQLGVTFTPAEPRPHQAALRIPATDDVVVTITAGVRGVRFTPASIDFGGVQPGRTATVAVTVENIGDDVLDVPLSVEGVGFTLGGVGSVVGLGAGASVTAQVMFAPTALGQASGRLVADLCDGADCDPAAVLSGAGANPTLVVSPATVDFGAVAAGDTIERTLTLQNAGQAELVVGALALTDASGFASLADAPTLPATIAAGASQGVTLRYAPTQGLASLDAVLAVSSNDPATPSATVALTGSTPGAGLVATPGALDFGVLDEGEAVELDVTVRSSGTAPAVIEALAFDGASGAFSLVGASPTLPRSLAVDETLTVRVRAAAGPNDLGGRADVLRFTLDTGAARAVPVSFAGGQSGCAPTVELAFVDISNVALGTSESGSIYVRNTGTAPCVLASAVAASGLPFPPQITFDAAGLAAIAPGQAGALSFTATLTTEESVAGSVDVTFQNVAPLRLSAFAAGVIPTVFSEVDGVDLGILPDGCVFGEQAIVLENTGATNAIITGIDIEPTGSPFTILDAPAPLPAALVAGKKDVILIGRVAAPEGLHQATLVVRGSANVVRIPLTMEVSAPGSAITQRFATPSAAMLDILFVIDNSGSMSDDQEELASNFPLFIAQPQFNDGTVDLHLAVTTTDTELSGEEGRLIGDPAVVTSDMVNIAAAFAANARVGTSGSGNETGLLGMQMALSPPNVPGLNDAFYRPEAALAVVIVTDEEDYSPDSVQSYVDFLRGMKGGGLAEGLVALSAALDLSYGAPPRYVEAVNAFGGMVLDIGVVGWGQSLGALADDLADLPQIYRLGDSPIGGVVTVSVDGAPAAGVQVDSVNNMFALGARAPVGSLVEAVYNGACSPP